MSKLNREAPFQMAHGLVAENEPLFYQDGKMFNTDGVEVTHDGQGNFTMVKDEAKPKSKTKAELEAERKAAAAEAQNPPPEEPDLI